MSHDPTGWEEQGRVKIVDRRASSKDNPESESSRLARRKKAKEAARPREVF